MIATVAPPTILVEPEKVEEADAEGEALAEGAEGVEGTTATTTEEGKPSDDKAKAAPGDKEGAAKPSDDKAKAVSGDKGKSPSKESKKK